MRINTFSIRQSAWVAVLMGIIWHCVLEMIHGQGTGVTTNARDKVFYAAFISTMNADMPWWFVTYCGDEAALENPCACNVDGRVVSCDAEGRIEEIVLPNNRMFGDLQLSILRNFTALKVIDLSSRSINDINRNVLDTTFNDDDCVFIPECVDGNWTCDFTNSRYAYCSSSPTAAPTGIPTTTGPTSSPIPSTSPTNSPTRSTPTLNPTDAPSRQPIQTRIPTRTPTGKPTGTPTGKPTSAPTKTTVCYAVGGYVQEPNTACASPFYFGDDGPYVGCMSFDQLSPYRDGKEVIPPAEPGLNLDTWCPTTYNYMPNSTSAAERKRWGFCRCTNLTASPTPAPIPVDEGDLQAWEEMYDSLDGDNWESCQTRTDPCSDISCSKDGPNSRYVVCAEVSNRKNLRSLQETTYRITQINLPSNGMSGVLSGSTIDQFTALTFLNITGNQITGNGPANDCVDAQICYNPGVQCAIGGSEGSPICGEMVNVDGPGGSGAWQVPGNGLTEYPELSVNVGESVLFVYGIGTGNVNRMPSLTSFDDCDFTQAELLADSSDGAPPNGFRLLITDQDRGSTLYIASSLPLPGNGNCQSGQRVKINVLATTSTPSPTSVPATNPVTQSPTSDKGGNGSDDGSSAGLAIALTFLILFCILPCLCFCTLYCVRKHRPDWVPEWVREKLDHHLLIVEEKFNLRSSRENENINTELFHPQPILGSQPQDGDDDEKPMGLDLEEQQRSAQLAQNQSLATAKLAVFQNIDDVVAQDIKTTEDLLRAANLTHHIDRFKQENMDLESVVYASDAHLARLGLNIGERGKLEAITKAIKGEKKPPKRKPAKYRAGQNVLIRRTGSTTAIKGEIVSLNNPNRRQHEDPEYIVKYEDTKEQEIVRQHSIAHFNHQH